MTNEEAIELIKTAIAEVEWNYPMDYAVALEMAIEALRDQAEAENLWHDAKENPPEVPGLYYGKKDDTNSMWLCKYRDGIWTLDSYPEQKMEITQWAEYTSFYPDEYAEAEENDPLTLEELREMDGDKIYIHYIGPCEGFYEDEMAPYYGKYEQYVQEYNGMLRACDLPLKYYRVTWLAYRHRPGKWAAMSEWISVKDALPGIQDGMVLAVVSGRYKNIRFDHAVELAEYNSREGWILEAYPEWETPDAAYWMPLPEPPEGE